jgi:Hereditary spastic paraplegia protein strumpellin
LLGPPTPQIVDKHFNDNWVFPVYMGVAFDLSEEWAGYKAAREALAMDCLQVPLPFLYPLTFPFCHSVRPSVIS